MIPINSFSRVKILQMEWLSKEANEATVTFEVNDREYRAFGFPVDFEEGKFYDVEFSFLDGIDLSLETMFSENKDKIKDLIIKPNSTWSYSAYGQVVSVNPIIVDCGFSVFDLGYLVISQGMKD